MKLTPARPKARSSNPKISKFREILKHETDACTTPWPYLEILKKTKDLEIEKSETDAYATPLGHL